MKRLACSWALVVCSLVFSCPANSQQSAELPRVNVGTGSGPSFVPDTWSGIQLTLSNPGSKPAELLCLTYVGEDESLQYGSRVWLPPHARLRVTQPIRIPPVPDGRVPSLDYHTLLVDVSAGTETLIPDFGGRLVRDGALVLGTRSKVTGFIDTPEMTPSGEMSAETVGELLLAARSAGGTGMRTSYFYDSPLAFYGPESLEALDCLVIADSRILAEPAALAAIRRWLFAGGRVWVLLDQVDPQVAEALLGDDFACQIVDRVGLTQVRIDAGPGGASVPDEVTEFDEPVDFVRVVASDVDVLYTVQSWPAAMLKRYGDGTLLITTLGPNGWLSTRSRDRSLPGGLSAMTASSSGTNERIGVVALRNIAADFFAEPRPPLVPPETLEPVVREYIGYRIPPANLVLGLLAMFNVVLIVAGLVLWRGERLHRFGWVVPLAALATAAAQVIVGQSFRRGVTPTAARLQIVRTFPGTDDQQTVGAAALSSPSALRAEIAGTHSGWAELKVPAGSVSTRRLVWTDHEAWRWENLRQPAGLQLAAFQSTTTTAPRITAVATLTQQGLTGQLQLGGDAQPEDCLIATRDGRIAVELRADGTFAAPASGVMSPRQFLSAGLLSDEQNRRQRVLAEVLANPQRPDFPALPQFCFWTSNWDTGVSFSQELRPMGSTLVTVPLRLLRPAAGAEVMIPAPLIAFRSVGGPDGTAAGGMYDNRQRQWLERSRPSRVWLEFQVPAVLLPLEATSARVVCEVSGPVKQLEVAAFAAGEVVPLATWSNPVGALTANVREPQQLTLSPRGTLLLRVTAGGVVSNDLEPAMSAENRASYWRIESLRLDLRGRVLADSDPSDTNPSSTSP